MTPDRPVALSAGGLQDITEKKEAMDRAEHLKWAKDRALEYADKGDAGLAMNSLIQDLGAHPETEASVSVVVHLMGGPW